MRSPVVAPVLSALVLITGLAAPVLAETRMCDFRPSELLGGKETGATGPLKSGAIAGVTAAGGSAQIDGFYTLSKVANGEPLTDSKNKLRGTRDAAQKVGSAVSAMATAATWMTPTSLAVGAVAAVGFAGLEQVCRFRDEKIEDHATLMAILGQMAEHADPDYFAMTKLKGDPAIRVLMPDGSHDVFAVSKLYIVDGELRHRDFGRNTVIGNVGYIVTKGDPVAFQALPQPVVTEGLEPAPPSPEAIPRVNVEELPALDPTSPGAPLE